MKRTLYIVLCIVMLAASLTACSPAAATQAPTQQPAAATEASAEPTAAQAEAPTAAVEAAPTTAPAAEPAAGDVPEEEKYGGKLVLAETGLKQFDPVFSADDPSFHVISNIFSLLFRQVEGQVVPDLATSWDIQEEGKVIVFHLRQGVMFHDDNEVFAKGKSREVVAEDVTYSIKSYVETTGTQAPADLVSAFQTVEAVDNYTVKLTLKTPDGLLFSSGRGLSSLGIVPKEAVEQLGEKFGQNPIGSGPFKFSEYVPDDHLTLVRNDLYWKKPYLDEVVYKIIPDSSVSVMSLESGEIDWMDNIPTTDYERLKADENYTMYSVMTCPVATQLMFNIKTAPYDDQQFRQAISYALDSQAIGKNIHKDMFVAGAGTAGPNVPGYDEDLVKYFVYDPEKAKQLLDELGYKAGSDGVRTGKDGKPLKLELEIWSMSPMPEYGAAIISQLKEVGLNVELQTTEFGTFLDDWNSGPNKMMTMQGFCGDGGMNTLFGTNGFGVGMGYVDEEIAALLQQGNETLDSAKKDEAVRQAADMMYSRYWAVPFGFNIFYQVSSARVHDMYSTLGSENLVTEKNNVWVSQE